MMGLSGAFSSLGINENASTSKKFPKTRSTISLPNIIFSEKPLTAILCDDVEKPIDFSKKYGEEKGTFNKVVKSYNNTFTMYAETDLDQPTDYSLRYAEDDSDSDRCNKKTEPTEFVQDTIKTYCTEDTPYETPFNFSTSTSMSDLRITENKDDSKDAAAAAKRPPKNKLKSGFSSGLMSPEKPVNYCEEGTPGYFSRVASCGSLNSIPDPPKLPEIVKKEPRRLPKLPTEVKAVKFEEVVNYAEETPLMFSRSSSLESLDSIEQHSIHDDRSSVVSDFSRLTSGIVSPSELPDSPSQTVPPSPKPSLTSRKSTDDTKTSQVSKCSVFEDVVKKFKVESTPLEFSTATSLSSLLDEVDGKDKSEDKVEKNLQLSESSEDEDILAACINIGMQNNRYSQTKATSPPKGRSPTFKFPDLVNSRFNKSSVLQLEAETDLQKNDVTSDSLRTYCTEGTPALLSHAGSNSNLSILSLNEKINSKDTIEDEKRALLDLNLCDSVGHEEAPENLEVEANHNSRSHRSSFSSLSDDSHESEEALLEECMLAGMPKGNSEEPSSHRMKSLEENLNEELSDNDDLAILEDCIKMGIENNRYVQNKLSPKNRASEKISANDVVNDTIKSYCTEDTPAILSHAGSCSNLSILSMQGAENEGSNYLSDVNSNFSDEDDEKLLEDCLKYGMATISEKVKTQSSKENGRAERVVTSSHVDATTSSSSSICFSDDSYESDQDLLQQCIQAGMPKKQEESGDLTAAEKALLQQCILEGMKKCRTTQMSKKQPEDDTSELTEAEQALLRQCILSGMPKNKNLAQGGPSRHRESAELTESERLLLQQCILAGMPKNRSKNFGKKKERSSGEHTCCIHCPRANKNRQNGYLKGRRKYKERTTVQYRDNRDVNIVYVTSQILTVKNEVDRTHENWV